MVIKDQHGGSVTHVSTYSCGTIHESPVIKDSYGFTFFHRKYWSAKRGLKCCTHVHVIACDVTFGLVDITYFLYFNG